MRPRNYKHLDVWQKSVRQTIELRKLAARFPDPERFGLVAQIPRAASSIPANMVEGWGKGRTKQYVQFMMIARGSSLELETHLIIAKELSTVSAQEFDRMQAQITDVSKMLNRLIGALKAR